MEVQDTAAQAVVRKKRKKKKKKGWLLWLLIILILLLLVIGLGYFAYGLLNERAKSRLARDESALGGMLPGKTPEEIGDLLNAKVEEGMVNIGIQGSPIFEYGGKKGRLGIENIAANHYSFRVDLILEDGSMVYQSGLIDPGYYIEYVELNKTLAPGAYPATAVFTTYSLDESEDKIAEAKVELTLYVTDGQFFKE
ncbi:MAG: hypothetical protein LBR77_00640 [Lachnospiraceae bacterium]|nr:hypothetical protein [Lachnospiraceae bacterium]